MVRYDVTCGKMIPAAPPSPSEPASDAATICASCGSWPAHEPPASVKQTSSAGASGDQCAIRTYAWGTGAAASPESTAPASAEVPPSSVLDVPESGRTPASSPPGVV